jgi:hypothetical protein
LSVFSCTARSAAVQGHPPGPEAEQKFFTRIPQQHRDLTDIKKWTLRKTAAGRNATAAACIFLGKDKPRQMLVGVLIAELAVAPPLFRMNSLPA